MVLGECSFLGQLSTNFHRGNVGKIQLTRTTKSSELSELNEGWHRNWNIISFYWGFVGKSAVFRQKPMI